MSGEYCGSRALESCLKDLGIRIERDVSLGTLREHSVTDMLTLKQAAESCGLDATAYRLSSTDVVGLSRLFTSLGTITRGIGWVESSDASSVRTDTIGHFFVVTAIMEDGTIFGYDPHDYAEVTFDANRSSSMTVLFLSKHRAFAETVRHTIAELTFSFFSSVAGLALLSTMCIWLTFGKVDLRLWSVFAKVFPVFVGRTFKAVSLTFVLAILAIFAVIRFEQSHSSVASHLQFERDTYSLGEISIGEAKTTSLTLRNTSDAAFTVDKVFGDCGCMTVQQSGQVVRPNSSVEVLVRLANPKLGMNSHRVVASSGETIAACTVQFLGISTTQIRPRRVFVGILDHTMSAIGSADLRIMNYLGPTLNDVSAHVLSERSPIRVTCAPDSVIANRANVQLFVELEAGRSERGLICEEVVLRAGEGEGVVELPFTICLEAR